MAEAVVDASVLLAFLRREPGADAALERLFAGVAMSTVNWAEVLTRMSDFGHELSEVRAR